MQLADVGRVTEIDRESFSTQWPPPNYKRELQNNLSRYVVAVDEDLAETEDGPQTVVKQERKGTVARIRGWFAWLFQKKDVPAAPATKEFIIGFAGIWMIADEAHVTSIAVREKYRGKGAGELLLIALIELAVRLKARTVTLEVRISNVIARNLYTKCGFSQVGLRRGYYTNNREDAVLMSTQDISSAAFQERFRQLKQDYLLTSRQMLRENILSGKW